MSLARTTDAAPSEIVVWAILCLVIATSLAVSGCSNVTSAAAKPAEPPSVHVTEILPASLAHPEGD